MSHKKNPHPAETTDGEKAISKEQTASAETAQPDSAPIGPEQAVEPGKDKPAAESRIQELEQQLQAALAASAENLDKFLRAKAETENIRRRAEIDMASAHKYAIERFAAETFDKGLCYAPGSGWAYSNPGYMLLKGIAEEVGGATFATLVSKRIAEPLNLRRIFVPESVVRSDPCSR